MIGRPAWSSLSLPRPDRDDYSPLARLRSESTKPMRSHSQSLDGDPVYGEEDDPVYTSSRREVVIILAVWSVAMIWTVGVCYLQGYADHPKPVGTLDAMIPSLERFDRDPAGLRTPFGLGIPDWVFWGIIFPWAISIAASAWFCFAVMTDDTEPTDAEALNTSNAGLREAGDDQ